MSDIVFTATLPPEVEASYRKNYTANYAPLRLIGPRRFLDSVLRTKVIVTVPGDPFDAKLIARLPNSVGLLASYSSGTDHIDLIAAQKRGLIVTNTPDVITAATADISMLLILGAARGASDAERLLRSGQWRGSSPDAVFGVDLYGKTLGIWGFGRIGRATAVRAHAFGMQIIYHGHYPKECAESYIAQFEPSESKFLARADILSLHLPSNDSTRNLLDRKRISLLKRGAIIINTARGDLVDDDALLDALDHGQVGAVGLDVFKEETAINPRWLSAPNTFLLPHIGSGTQETRAAMGALVLINIEAFLSGQVPPNKVA
jgi:lactate dehydrogenase-like 2-hydroxyacid dehydrogenase